jgi:hypothetical protein
MEMPSGLDSTVGIPCNSVDNARSNQDNTHRANPTLAFFGFTTSCLRNLKFNAALDFNVRDARAKAS